MTQPKTTNQKKITVKGMSVNISADSASPLAAFDKFIRDGGVNLNRIRGSLLPSRRILTVPFLKSKYAGGGVVARLKALTGNQK